MLKVSRWRRLNYRAADFLYPFVSDRLWNRLPIRIKAWFFLNCGLIN